jgi:sarcosine/dimethylglycine N-methyltransferase
MTAAIDTDPVRTAREYYDSEDADRFYASIWGGEDIHIGLYETASDPIFEASRRTVEHLADRLVRAGKLDASTRVLDIGSGYGGGARYLAQAYGCRVVALNLSAVENTRARALNAAQGLDERINVVDGSFEAIPAADAAFDVVWSQDAILHSGDRARVLAEVARVLAPGGHFVFTDPMQADDCPQGVLEPILARIHLSSLGSPGFYREAAARVGLREIDFEPLTHQLVAHYQRVLDETTRRTADLAAHVSGDYIERMKKGLRHWIEGGQAGWLTWGVLSFRKP